MPTADKIRLKNMRFHAFHGCEPDEREDGREIQVDVELSCDLSKASTTDDLNDTCDFKKIYSLVSETVLETRFSLLEALGEEICTRILNEFPGVEIKVNLRKPQPPLEGELDYVEVEIVR